LSTQGRSSSSSSSRWRVLWFSSRFSQCGVESSPHSTGIRLQRKSQCGGIYKATTLSLSLSLHIGCSRAEKCLWIWVFVDWISMAECEVQWVLVVLMAPCHCYSWGRVIVWYFVRTCFS
jgi:hypothetical protein